MKLVRCVWEDAARLEEGPWVDREGATKPEPVIFHQVGYLFALTHELVVLTACVGKEQMAPRDQIPVGMVRELVELVEGAPVKIPKRRRTK